MLRWRYLLPGTLTMMILLYVGWLVIQHPNAPMSSIAVGERTPDGESDPPSSAWLAYADTKGDIAITNIHSTEVITLTDDPDEDTWPAWSPDGSRLVFTSWHGEVIRSANVYVIDADGSNRVKLERGLEPVWSPDGTQIAVRGGDITVMRPDGSESTRLANPEASILELVWSPAGDSLLFTSKPGGYYTISVINADGSGLHVIADGRFAAWSPDGQQIVFGGDHAQIFTVNRDGSGLTRLTDEEVWTGYPAWSPDGQHIAFTWSQLQQEELRLLSGIVIMKADGSEQRTLTEAEGSYESLAWSPDGRYLAFEHRPAPHAPTIYVADIAQGTMIEVADGSEPVWQPLPLASSETQSLYLPLIQAAVVGQG